MKLKKILLILGIVVVICLVIVVLLIKKNKEETAEYTTEKTTEKTTEEQIDYSQMIDEECGINISKYLEYDEAIYTDEDIYELQFKVKDGCEVELEATLLNKYGEEQSKENVPIPKSSIGDNIESGTIKHIYSFFREGKVVSPSGEHSLSVQVGIYVVEIDNQLYAFVYTI
ncbi:MAG: hypothetical protein E7263_04825 [Lachnospiraceae bacterium]|nr:hypothetical protein [Lachnospiraceae bacterium]